MAVSQETIYIYRNLDSTPLRVDKMQTFVYMDLRCTNRSCLFNGLLKYSFDDPEAALNEGWQYESIAHLAAHQQTPPMNAYSEAVKGDVLEMNIRILQPGI